MSGFSRRARLLTFGGLATLGLAAVAQLAVTSAAVSADATYVVPLHQTPPIQNSTFEEKGDCPGSPAQWGWHFVLSTDDASFVSLTTTFATTGVVVTTSFGPPTDKHAYVYTATDDTLLSAVATVSGGDPEKTMLLLSHTCAGGGGTETPTPTPSVSATETPTPTPTESVTPTETVTPTESVQPTETETTPAETTPPATTAPPTTPSESETPTPEVSGTVITTTPAETVSETPSETASVLPTKLTQSPSESVEATTTVTPSVQGVKSERPNVGGTGLPRTGTPLPVGLLVLLGFGLVGAGVVATVAGEPQAAGGSGKHRR